MALTTILGLVDVHRQTHPLRQDAWDDGCCGNVGDSAIQGRLAGRPCLATH